jgi:hypothetical protein
LTETVSAFLSIVSKLGMSGAAPALVEGGLPSGATGRALSVAGDKGEAKGDDIGKLGEAGRLSFLNGWGELVGDSKLMLGIDGVVFAAASSFRFANRALARTALAGNSSNSRLP